MFQEIAAQYGRLDILVLNAARAPFKTVGELLRRDLLELVENNYLSNVYCMQQALPLMQGRPGHVVFVSSLGSRFALPSYPLGSMKAAMEALVKQWAVELKDRQITVNGVTAGLLRTDSLMVLRQYWPGVERPPSSSWRTWRAWCSSSAPTPLAAFEASPSSSTTASPTSSCTRPRPADAAESRFRGRTDTRREWPSH